MNLDPVRVFTRVVRLGSFSAAARALDIPKSTVSRRVSELEDALGARLLHRTTRKISLTDAGRVYFARTERLIEELEAADRAVLELRGRVEGTLRLTTPADMGSSMLAPAFPEFQRLYPDLKLVLLATNRRVDLVGEGVDLALRAGPLGDSSLVARRFDVPPLRLYASPDYHARRGKPTSVLDLAAHDCLVFSGRSNEGLWTLSGPDGEASVRVRGSFAASDFGALRRACLHGMGVALLPSANVVEDERAGALERVLPRHRGPETLVHAVFPSASHLSPKVRAFIDFLGGYMQGIASEAREPASPGAAL